MVKQLISIAVIGGVGALSACFGDGPTPGVPDGAIVVLSSAPGQNCSTGTYIGPVVIGSDHGYVSFLPYQPVGNNCGGGGGSITAPQQVFSFGLGGEALTMIGSAGESGNGAHVQIAATDSGPAWAYNEQGAGSNGNQVLVHPGTMTYGTNMGTEVPLGLAAIGSDLYVATENNAATTGGTDLENPTFPNTGNGTLNGTQGSIWKVGGGKVASWTPGCGGLDRCVVGGGSGLVYVEHPATGGNVQWQITRYDVGAGSAATTQMISSQTTGADFPYGLDADDHLVAWSTTQSCVFDMMSTNQRCEATDCSISVFDTTTPQAAPKTLLATTQFGCLDAKLADGYVYFTIVGIYSGNNTMFGRGIGRVSIADRTIETLDLGIRGPYAGPRRIFPVGDQLFLVDPLVMARIPKTALDGKHDFTP